MSDVEIVVGIRGDDSGGRVIKRSLDDIGKSAKTVTGDVGHLGTTQKGLNKILEDAISPIERLNAKQAEYNRYLRAGVLDQENYARATQNNQRAIAQLSETGGRANAVLGYGARLLAGYISVQSVKNIFEAADNFQSLEGRIKLATEATGDYSKVQQQLISIAKETGTSLDANVTLFQRLSNSRGDLGLTNDAFLKLVGTVDKFGAIGKASSDEIKNASIQLSQALSGGTVRAEEFNSIVENLNPLAQAVAKQFGISFGELRARIVAGTVSSRDFAEAIVKAGDEADKTFGKLPASIDRSVESIETAATVYVGGLNKSTGATTLLAEGIDHVANNFDAFIENGYKLNPITNEIISLKTAMDDLKGSTNTYGDVFTGVWETINDLIDKSIGRLDQFALSFKQVSNVMLGGDGLDKEGQNALFEATQRANKQIPSISEAIKGARVNRLEDQNNQAYNQADYDDNNVDTRSPYTPAHKKTPAERAAEKAARDALREEKKLQNELTSAINGSRTEQEKLNDEIAHLEKLKGIATTKEQVDLLNRGIRNTQAELDKVRTKVELDSPTAKAFKAMADEVQDGFKDAFKGAFDGGGSMFKKFADGIKATFKSLLLDLAYQAAVRPIVVSILGGIGGAMGLPGSAVASTLGTTGGAASGLSSLFGSGTSLLSIGKSLLNGGVGTGLGNFAGKASSFLGGSFSQNMAVQKFFTNAGSFGNIAGGLAGSLGANLLGLGSKNPLVNGVSGTLGGLIGSVGGPLGSIAGSFLGTALGGLFGGKKPSDMAQGGGINFATLERYSGGQTGKKYSAANANYRDTILNTIENVIKTVQSVGGSASGSANITIGSRDGLRYNGANFGGNSAAFNNAIFTDLKNSITGLTATFQTILNKVGVQAPDNLANAFAFGQQYDETLNPKTVSMQLADAIKVLDGNMTALIQTASELGLPIDAYTSALQKQKDAAIGALKAQAAGFASLEDMTKTFNDFLNGEALGSNSSLNPMDKLNLAQNSFGGLLTKAQGGDLSVTQDLLKAADQLISVSKGVYASSTSFVGIEQFVRTSVEGVAKQAGATGYDTQEVIANNVIQSNAVLVEQNKAMQEEIIKMRKVMESLRNQLSVAS